MRKMRFWRGFIITSGHTIYERFTSCPLVCLISRYCTLMPYMVGREITALGVCNCWWYVPDTIPWAFGHSHFVSLCQIFLRGRVLNSRPTFSLKCHLNCSEWIHIAFDWWILLTVLSEIFLQDQLHVFGKKMS